MALPDFEIPNPFITAAQWRELNSPRWPDPDAAAETAKIKRLMWAILNDALDCLSASKPREGMKMTPGVRLALQRETKHWINSNSRGPFSFLTVCEVFDLDPGRIRRLLRTEAPPPLQHRNFVSYGYYRVVDAHRPRRAREL